MSEGKKRDFWGFPTPHCLVRSHLSFSFPPSLTLQSSTGLPACALRIPWKRGRPVGGREALKGNWFAVFASLENKKKNRKLHEPVWFNTSWCTRVGHRVTRAACASPLCVQSGVFARRNWCKTRSDAHTAGYSRSPWRPMLYCCDLLSTNQRAAVHHCSLIIRTVRVGILLTLLYRLLLVIQALVLFNHAFWATLH